MMHSTGRDGVIVPPLRQLRPLLGVVAMAVLAAGCTSQGERAKGDGKKGEAKGDAEAEIRQVFADFQGAVKARDGGKLWDLLAEDSRQDAERKAKAVREDFNKNNDHQRKDEMAANLELSAAELKDLDAKGYLKSKQFFGKYHEVPDSKVEKVTVTGDKAQLTYVEEDGDKVPMKLEREKGHWKLLAEMPK
jgi:hypothetical protein